MIDKKSVDKSMLHQVIIQKLEAVYASSLAATKTAIDTATDKENVPQHKYDTLSLEASYLAHGQGQRLQQCLRELHSFKALPVKDWSVEDAVSIGALIELFDDNDNSNKWFFLSPVAGGLNVSFSDHSISLVTPESPLGKALNKKMRDDEVVVDIAGRIKCYEVMSIY
ncbi:transcription elongation factor [Vibrio sp. S11_S32]|uniref:GreA/GreB family elongation factor n=1 Tax=Vibrio sp. S11_S32 TaxID=2720225 RepID=UPI0016806BE8|nr:GreA/GreB family elongation factor [Vibrio sp. S11_S32]MBD1575142.1 transcription elongation factor [Vibrio sp. S11_S32]